jgi:hypothetical protein
MPRISYRSPRLNRLTGRRRSPQTPDSPKLTPSLTLGLRLEGTHVARDTARTWLAPLVGIDVAL